MAGNWMDTMLLSCRKASMLMDKRSALGLSLIERGQLLAHRSICKTCRIYARQVRILDRMLEQYLSDIDFAKDAKLSPEARERLDDRLK